MKERVIIEVKILAELEIEDGDYFTPSWEWLKQNIKNHLDWEQGDCYPEEDAPLQ